MANSSLQVIARIVARPDKVQAVAALLLRLIEPARQEPGCLRYELLQNQTDPTDFTFIEEWASAEALDAHLKSKHLAEVGAELPELIATEIDIRRYSVLA